MRCTLAKDSLHYTRLLRKLEDFGNTIEINCYNYNEAIAQICDTLENDKEELSFLAYLGGETAPHFRRQIEADLEYFKHGTELVSQAIASIRGVVEIDQAERDRTREANEQKLQDNIQAIGVGIATGAIIASSSGVMIEPWTFPWQQQHGKYPHPFFIAVIGSGVFAWLAWKGAKWLIKKGRKS